MSAPIPVHQATAPENSVLVTHRFDPSRGDQSPFSQSPIDATNMEIFVALANPDRVFMDQPRAVPKHAAIVSKSRTRDSLSSSASSSHHGAMPPLSSSHSTFVSDRQRPNGPPAPRHGSSFLGASIESQEIMARLNRENAQRRIESIQRQQPNQALPSSSSSSSIVPTQQPQPGQGQPQTQVQPRQQASLGLAASAPQPSLTGIPPMSAYIPPPEGRPSFLSSSSSSSSFSSIPLSQSALPGNTTSHIANHQPQTFAATIANPVAPSLPRFPTTIHTNNHASALESDSSTENTAAFVSGPAIVTGFGNHAGPTTMPQAPMWDTNHQPAPPQQPQQQQQHQNQQQNDDARRGIMLSPIDDGAIGGAIPQSPFVGLPSADRVSSENSPSASSLSPSRTYPRSQFQSSQSPSSPSPFSPPYGVRFADDLGGRSGGTGSTSNRDGGVNNNDAESRIRNEEIREAARAKAIADAAERETKKCRAWLIRVNKLKAKGCSFVPGIENMCSDDIRFEYEKMRESYMTRAGVSNVQSALGYPALAVTLLSKFLAPDLIDLTGEDVSDDDDDDDDEDDEEGGNDVDYSKGGEDPESAACRRQNRRGLRNRRMLGKNFEDEWKKVIVANDDSVEAIAKKYFPSPALNDGRGGSGIGGNPFARLALAFGNTLLSTTWHNSSPAIMGLVAQKGNDVFSGRSSRRRANAYGGNYGGYANESGAAGSGGGGRTRGQGPIQSLISRFRRRSRNANNENPATAATPQTPNPLGYLGYPPIPFGAGYPFDGAPWQNGAGAPMGAPGPYNAYVHPGAYSAPYVGFRPVDPLTGQPIPVPPFSPPSFGFAGAQPGPGPASTSTSTSAPVPGSMPIPGFNPHQFYGHGYAPTAQQGSHNQFTLRQATGPFGNIDDINNINNSNRNGNNYYQQQPQQQPPPLSHNRFPASAGLAPHADPTAHIHAGTYQSRAPRNDGTGAPSSLPNQPTRFPTTTDGLSGSSSRAFSSPRGDETPAPFSMVPPYPQAPVVLRGFDQTSQSSTQAAAFTGADTTLPPRRKRPGFSAPTAGLL